MIMLITEVLGLPYNRNNCDNCKRIRLVWKRIISPTWNFFYYFCGHYNYYYFAVWRLATG